MRLVIALVVASAAVACKFPPPPDVPDDADVGADGGIDGAVDAPSRRTIGGAVAGLWTGGLITLHLQAGAVADDVAAGPSEAFQSRPG